MNRLRIILLAAFLLCSGPAFTNNGAVKTTFTLPLEFYVDCLGEVLAGEASVTATGHEFVTPTGKFHVVVHWLGLTVVSSTSTGNTWIAKNAPAPFVLNSSINTGNATQPLVLKPVDGGPRTLQHAQFKIRFDDEGNIIAVDVKFATGNLWRCVNDKK